MPTLKAILLTLALAVALVGAAPDTAEAGPKPPPSVSYYFADQTVTDADGTVRTRNFLAQVTTNPDGSRTIKCTYTEQRPDPNRPGRFLNYPDGQYVGPYGSTTTAEDLRQVCIASYPNRTPV